MSAQARDDARARDLGQVLGAYEGEGVIQVLTHGILHLAELDKRAFSSQDLDDRGGDLEAPHGIGQAVVVGEDDDLAIDGHLA